MYFVGQPPIRSRDIPPYQYTGGCTDFGDRKLFPWIVISWIGVRRSETQLVILAEARSPWHHSRCCGICGKDTAQRVQMVGMPDVVLIEECDHWCRCFR